MVEENKKTWTTPEVVEYGDVAELTLVGAPPPKDYNGADGATWGGQQVGWAS
jgi:hypothetical protein